MRVLFLYFSAEEMRAEFLTAFPGAVLKHTAGASVPEVREEEEGMDNAENTMDVNEVDKEVGLQPVEPLPPMKEKEGNVATR